MNKVHSARAGLTAMFSALLLAVGIAGYANALPGSRGTTEAQAQSGERLIGRLSVTSWGPPGLQLHLYGVYSVGVPNGVPTAVFNPAVTPASAKRVALLYIGYAAGIHQYRLDCQLHGEGVTTDYWLSAQDNTGVQTSTQPGGPVTVSFRVAVDSPDAGRRYWVLGNSSGQAWTFFGCDVSELLT